MKFKYFRNLNKNERYSTTKRQLKSVFSNIEMDVLFGLIRKFEFDSRCPNKPNIVGNVVASISYSRDRTVDFSLYPLLIAGYPNNASDDFNNQILLTIKQWLEGQINKPDTALLGYEELIIEWTGHEHLLHKVKFL
ncbi:MULTISPECIES: hypothetical protein [Priestia]|uniref:hypothetical protein n=1 Tax=Priestia TaxID=2800373 RepID=UPI002330C449|nr:hypothetical protein [Priestia sp. AB]MDC0705849.1 hypothetical protein [Priestia sp. AB]MED4212620.1 hypothetical protein [Priestia megaterium]